MAVRRLDFPDRFARIFIVAQRNEFCMPQMIGVVDLKNFPLTGALGLWLGLDPTDAPLLLRDLGSDDVYALSLEHK